MKRAKKVEVTVAVDASGAPFVLTNEGWMTPVRFGVESIGEKDRLATLTEPSPLTAKERDELRKLRRVAKAAARVVLVNRDDTGFGMTAAIGAHEDLKRAVAALEKGRGR